MNTITKPTLLLDKHRCLLNIKKMATKTKISGLSFRPHFKTHQSAEIGNWYRDFGIKQITVSSIDMASKFIKAGWGDILIAFPLNILELNRLQEFSAKCKISVLIDNKETLAQTPSLSHKIYFYIDIDTGYNRTGIPTDNINEIEEIINISNSIKNLEFLGFYCHGGHSYKTKNRDEKDIIHEKALANLNSLKTYFKAYSPKILYGDTPNCSLQTKFDGIDEITPGNFVFYDYFQYSIGSCSENEIAVAMACPVVGKYKHRSEIVIHGGGVHFSKENIIRNNSPVFGRLVEQGSEGWKLHQNELYLDSLSQEHGVMNVAKNIDNFKIGDILLFYPIHSCLTANLMKSYITTEGQYISQ